MFKQPRHLISRSLGALSLFFCAITFGWAQTNVLPKGLVVLSERDSAVYETGEEASFLIRLNEGSSLPPDAELSWTLSKDGVAPVTKGKVRLENGEAKVSGKLDEPGFLRLEVDVPALVGGENKVQKIKAGVAVSPERIQPSQPVPDDFNAFWKARLEALAAVPMDVEWVRVEEDHPKAECFDLKIACLGKPVSGYFARPKGDASALKGKLPAVLWVQGAGVRSSNKGSALAWSQKGKQGALALEINAHGILNGQDEGYYQKLDQTELKGYRLAEHNRGESGYFVGMFLRVKRALDFLCAQPEWDGKTLVVAGSSQGGYQALAAGALDERVSFIGAGVSAGCDHTAMLVQRVAGWPKIVPLSNEGVPEAEMLKWSRYIDGVNFAAMSHVKGAYFTAAFVDEVCPPTSVYAAFNALPIKEKVMFNDLYRGHAQSSAASGGITKAVEDHLKGE